MPAMSGKEEEVNTLITSHVERNFSDKALSKVVQIGSISRNQSFSVGIS